MLPDKKPEIGFRCCLRLRRGGPLEQMALAYGHAPEGAHSRVEQHQRLRRYLAELPRGSAHGAQKLTASFLKKVMPGNAPARGHETRERTQQGPGQQRGQRCQQADIERQRTCEDHPDDQCKRQRHDQRAAQVVAHLPQAQRVDTVTPGVQHQGQQLPVAASPAVVARSRHPRVMRVLLDQRHIADKAAARNIAFQQIVAQHRFRGQAPVKHGMHRINMQQTLAAEAAGAKQVLVYIRHAAAIGVNAALAGKQSVIGRVLGRVGKGRHHPWLQNAVAADHAAQRRIHARRIERMGCHSDQFAQRARRQAGIAVKGDDITDAFGKLQPGGQGGETLHAASDEQSQQLLQLAALALPAEPAPLGFAPAARAMYQEESRARIWRGCITCIQCRQPGQRVLEHGRIAGQAGAGRVNPVCQQGKLRLFFPVGKPVPFQPLYQFLVGSRGRQQGRDDHHYTVLGRDAA